VGQSEQSEKDRGMANYLFTTLNDPSATAGTFAHGINDSGEIVGYYVSGATTNGFLYSNGTYNTIDNNQTISGGDTKLFSGTAPQDINDSGEIVGYELTGDGGIEEEGFSVSSPYNSFVSYEDDPSNIGGGQAQVTAAESVNSQGEFVGYFANTTSGEPIGTFGFIGQTGEFLNSVPTLKDPLASSSSSGGSTRATGVNDEDEVIGYFVGSDPNLPNSDSAHGFFYNNGVYSYFDDPNAVNGTFAEGINNADMIVGYYVDGNGISDGFIFNQPTGQYITVDVPGATNTFIYGINNSDEIVGDYVDASGKTHGFEASLLSASGGNNDIWVLSGGQWEASAQPGSHPAGYNVAAIGDWTGGGTDGILWFNPTTGDTDEWQMSNAGWAASVDLGSHPGNYQISGDGSFAGNGIDDVLWTSVSGNGQVQTDIWQLSSSGQWAASVSPGSHPAGYEVAGVGDFTGNGTSDILWYDPTTGDVDEWLIANGKWSASIDLGSHPGNGWQVAGVGDFTGNGTDDVLWFNAGTGQTDIWELSNGKWGASVSPGTHPLGYQVAAVGNFAGTGTDGILWYNPSTGDTDEWQLSNGKWAASVDLGTHPGNFQIAGVGNFINGNSTSDILWHSS